MSGSTSRSILSRAGSLPRERCRSSACSPPPRATAAGALTELGDEPRPSLVAARELVGAAHDLRRQDRHLAETIRARRPTVDASGVLFNSFPFLFAFLPLVAAAYFLIPRHRLRLLLLVGGVRLLLRLRRVVVPGADGCLDS